jgi:GH25 family lysozyme M1 (1,4-beta-N-acetylmuramidase)
MKGVFGNEGALPLFLFWSNERTTSNFQETYLREVPMDRPWIREVLLKPKEGWMFWQFSPRGRVRGVSGMWT